MFLNNQQVTEKNQKGNQKTSRNKWQWKYDNSKPMGCWKNSSKREVYGNTILPQEIRKERNQRGHKQMEKYTLFMDWKNQYCENEYTAQSNLYIQCNPCQATNGILHTTRTNNFTICMEIQKTSNSQSNLEKEEQNCRNQPAWLQDLLQSHSHQDSMVLAQRQKYRSMEQNKKPRDKSTHLWTPNLWQRRQEYTMEKRQPL